MLKGDLALQADQTVGGSYLGGGGFGSNSQFGKNQTQLNTSRGDLGNSYDSYIKQVGDTTKSAYDQAGQYYNDNLGSTQTQLGGIDTQQGMNPFRYGFTASTTPINTPKVDVSKYTPFTNFQSLTGAPQTATGGYTTPKAGANPFSGGSTVDTYLGRTASTLGASQKDYLSKYLLGKSGY
jgi:hypothetical protein